MLNSGRKQSNYFDQQTAVEETLFSSVPVNNHPQKPHGWTKPSYNTPQYWEAYGFNWITDAEALQDQQNHEARKQRAKQSRGTIGKFPNRWLREAPQETRQYANSMSTEAARDDRLTPQAKALLQIIRARCGKGRVTQTTKYTLGDILGRSQRSIQRYICELVRFGYIKTQTRKNRRGLYTGLIIAITEKVLPYFQDLKELACDLAEKFGHEWSETRSFLEETLLSSKNESINISSYKPSGHAYGMT